VNAINNVREAHVASLNDGEVDPWIAAFTNDGVQMRPNAPGNLDSESNWAWSHASFQRLPLTERQP